MSNFSFRFAFAFIILFTVFALHNLYFVETTPTVVQMMSASVKRSYVPLHQAPRETGECREMYNRPDTPDQGCTLIWHVDSDADGFGAPETCLCFYGKNIPDPQLAPEVGDCDDRDHTVHPNTADVCDGRDNDCDGRIDETPDAHGAEDGMWYLDRDGDGHVDLTTGITRCDGPERRYVRMDEAGDCNDNDPKQFPGQGCGKRAN